VDTLLISATVEASNFKFGTQLGFGTSLPKNYVLDQNWRAFGLGEHCKNYKKVILLSSTLTFRRCADGVITFL